MRFLASEHKAIQAAIKDKRLDPNDFSSIKKKGRLHLFYKESGKPFVFFRKTETRLNASGGWEKAVHYYVFEGSQKNEFLDWKAVMKAFEAWLDQIQGA